MDPLRYGHLSAFVYFRRSRSTGVVGLAPGLPPEALTGDSLTIFFLSASVLFLSLAVFAACPGIFPDGCSLQFFFLDLSPERVRVISIARLSASPHVHLRPIYVFVLNDPYVEILS